MLPVISASAVRNKFAEAMPLQAACGETVLKELREQRFIIRQGGQILPQIARRQHAEFLAQDARAAAIISDGHNGGDVIGLPFEGAQHRWQA